MVDWQTLFNIAVSLVGFFGGYMIKSVFDAIAELRKTDKDHSETVNNLRVALPTIYVSKDDFKQMGDQIFGAIREMKAETNAALVRIEAKIDSKADKHG